MKTAIIWGAGGGIGRALLARLRDEGWQVAAVSRNPQDLADLTPHCFKADVANVPQVQAAVAAVQNVFTKVDLWVYAAGFIIVNKVSEMSASIWQRVLDANLNGAFITTHYSLPLLARGAHLFYIGAQDELLRQSGLSAYVAAKAGLEAFSMALAHERRQQRVTLVRPASVATPFWELMPFPMPSDALLPETLADLVLAAYTDRHEGILNL